VGVGDAPKMNAASRRGHKGSQMRGIVIKRTGHEGVLSVRISVLEVRDR
jgi:hypothetical protein